VRWPSPSAYSSGRTRSPSTSDRQARLIAEPSDRRAVSSPSTSEGHVEDARPRGTTGGIERHRLRAQPGAWSNAPGNRVCAGQPAELGGFDAWSGLSRGRQGRDHLSRGRRGLGPGPRRGPCADPRGRCVPFRPVRDERDHSPAGTCGPRARGSGRDRGGRRGYRRHKGGGPRDHRLDPSVRCLQPVLERRGDGSR
jgi:hypothetical protein